MVQILVYQLSCVTVFIRSDLFLSVTKIVSYRTTTSESRESFDIFVFRIIEHGVNDFSFSQAEKKKVILFLEIDRMKKIYHSPARIVGCASRYAFLSSKNIKQTTKKQSKKAKETNEEKRISPENRLKKINLRPAG